MTLSEDTIAVIDYLDQYSQGSLRKKNDVAVLLELAALQLNADIIAELSFHGSAMWRVFSVMRKSSPGSEGFMQLETEFANAMNILREHILLLSGDAEEEIQTRFHDTYLHVQPGAIRNLCDLAHDLSHFKELQNSMRRNP